MGIDYEKFANEAAASAEKLRPALDRLNAEQIDRVEAEHEFMRGFVEDFTADLRTHNRRLTVRLRRAYRALQGR